MFEEKDLTQVKNLIKVLKQGKWELGGEEILAFQQLFSWAIGLHIKIDNDLKIKKSELEAKAKLLDAKKLGKKSKIKKA